MYIASMLLYRSGNNHLPLAMCKTSEATKKQGDLVVSHKPDHYFRTGAYRLEIISACVKKGLEFKLYLAR